MPLPKPIQPYAAASTSVRRQTSQLVQRASTYSCSDCSNTFRSRRELLLHRECHLLVTRCQICLKSFKSFAGASAHFRAAHVGLDAPEEIDADADDEDDGNLTCLEEDEIKEKGSDDEDDFDNGNSPSLLPKLPPRFSTPTKFKKKKSKSVLSVSNPAPVSPITAFVEAGEVTCDICAENFFTRGQLVGHRRKRHPETHGDHVCYRCGRRYKTTSSLRGHVTKVHKRGDAANGNDDVVTTSSPPALLKFTCKEPDCGLVFEGRSLFRAHAATHAVPEEEEESMGEPEGDKDEDADGAAAEAANPPE